MKVGDFVVNFNRRKLGQIIELIGDNGDIFGFEVKTFGGAVITLLPEEIGEYCSQLIPLLKMGDIVNGFTINTVVYSDGIWKAIVQENVLEFEEKHIRYAMTKEMCSMFSFWKK